MDPLEAIRRAQATRLVEDGDEVELELAPALSPAEIERLEDEVDVPLPRELRVLLGHTAGIDGGPLETIDFTGRSLSLGSEALPWGLPIAGDGFGSRVRSRSPRCCGESCCDPPAPVPRL